MEIGVGPARYEDLNSDLPVCTSIRQDFLLIQSVTGLGILNKSSSVHAYVHGNAITEARGRHTLAWQARLVVLVKIVVN